MPRAWATPSIARSVGVFQAPEGEAGGKTYPDPYFGGEGPERTTCIGCGGCMMGCRYNAKNTLDKNYLYLAEKHGARVFAETKVVDVTPLNGKADGSEGYEVRTVKSTAWFGREPRRFTCRGVVFAASALGTMDLLFRLKQKGSLPALSDQLGNRVRTNAESLIGVRVPRQPRGSVEGHRDRLGHLHRRIHAHRGDSLPGRLRRHGPSGYAADRRPARSHAHLSVAENSLRLAAAPSHPHRALPAPVRLGARIADPALHANAGRPHRHAPGAAVVLAFPQNAGEPGQENPNLHSAGQ